VGGAACCNKPFDAFELQYKCGSLSTLNPLLLLHSALNQINPSRHSGGKRMPQVFFLGYFYLFSPVVVLKTTQHREKFLKPARTAHRHMKTLVLVLPGSMQEKILAIFSKDVSYSGPNTQHRAGYSHASGN
jgi:hypothetical protein